MAQPPFTMSKYASETDLLRDKCAWLEKAFKDAEDRANAVSVMHGEKFQLAGECLRFARAVLEASSELTVQQAEGFMDRLKALDLRLYGPGRPVPRHRSGGGAVNECFIAHMALCGELLSQQQANLILSGLNPNLYLPSGE